jgi:hypothetical protein
VLKARGTLLTWLNKDMRSCDSAIRFPRKCPTRTLLREVPYTADDQPSTMWLGYTFSEKVSDSDTFLDFPQGPPLLE